MTTLFVLSGPSGAGKSALIERLLANDPGIRFSVSCTTRAPRPGETDGVDYRFINRDRFEGDIRAGRFFEYAEFSGNLYGTHFSELEEAALQRRDLLLDIEVQGARQLQEKGIDRSTSSWCRRVSRVWNAVSEIGTPIQRRRSNAD